MLNNEFFKRWYIKICRYLLGRRFLRVMAGPLKGYRWSTSASYEYILGTYEDAATLQAFQSWLTPGAVFYDIGANLGFHSLVASQVIKSGTIYAFEPMPAVKQQFEDHLRLNRHHIGPHHIKLQALAIAGNSGQVEFSNDIKYRDGNTYIKDSYVFKGAAQKIEVPCQSIDGLLQQGYAPPGIIKIDVEGAEYDVLLGAISTLKKYQPCILLATHNCHLPGVQQKCIDLLQELGYQLKHTGQHNKHQPGLDDYIAIPKSKIC